MKCRHCKKKIPDDAFFCPYCGLVVDDEAEYADEESPKVLWKPREEKQHDNVKSEEDEKNTLKDKAEWYSRSPEKQQKKRADSNKYLGIIGMVILIMVFLMIAIWLVFSTLDANEKRAREERQEALKAEEQKNRQQREENLAKNKGSTKSDDEEDVESDTEEYSGDITLSLVDEPEDFGDYYKLFVTDASASSVISQEGTDNSAIKACDGSEKSSWQEGVAGDGIGESLHFQLARSYKVKYMSFQLGNWNSDEYYAGNNRPKELEITVGDISQSVVFPDGKTEYWIELSQECTASEIDLVIQSVYSGSKWDDTCIAEIGIYGRSN
ncbi:MAG: NADase-type glycan-binding domain-containing protein [Lachnospiraceae bacterium]